MQITQSSMVPDDELTFEFMRSSGPGGQNVNKVETAVRLRFDIELNRTLPAEVKSRLYNLAGNRISKAGVLTIVARNSRRQQKNREEALDKFRSLLLQAHKKPKPYKRTSIPFQSKLNRLENKKRRSQQKLLRRLPQAGNID